MRAAEADTPGVEPGGKLETLRLLSRFGSAPEPRPPLAGDVSVATDELGVGVAIASGAIDDVGIALGVGSGVAFSTAWGLRAGDLIGTVPCLSNCRAALLSFPRSRAGVGEPGTAVLTGVAVGCGSPTTPGVDGEVAAGDAVRVARGASVGSGGDVGEDAGEVIGVAIARGVNVRCGMGVDVPAIRGGDVGAGVAVGLAAAVAVGVVDAVVAGAELVSVARTNFFGGASRGGVASDLIFARAWSASRWLLIAAHPRSTVAWAIVSLMVRGRSLGRTGAITGAGISRTSPRTVARGSFTVTLGCRSRRKRLIGV